MGDGRRKRSGSRTGAFPGAGLAVRPRARRRAARGRRVAWARCDGRFARRSRARDRRQRPRSSESWRRTPATNAWYTPPRTRRRAPSSVSPSPARSSQVTRVLDRVLASASPERVVLFGFSQGGCLALELFLARGARLEALVALSGAFIGPAEELPPLAPGLAGTTVLLGAAEADPYLTPGDVQRTARTPSAAADCRVTLEMAPGLDAHVARRPTAPRAGAALRPRRATDTVRLRQRALERGPPGRSARTPKHRRAAPPLTACTASLISGTAFTAARAQNSRTWLYRMRPAALQGEPSLPSPTRR